jgi:hypothetical protein
LRVLAKQSCLWQSEVLGSYIQEMQLFVRSKASEGIFGNLLKLTPKDIVEKYQSSCPEMVRGGVKEESA